MKIKRNLEDQVQYLTERTEIASLGLNLIGFIYPSDSFPETAENGSVIGVGTHAPYDYYVYLNDKDKSLYILKKIIQAKGLSKEEYYKYIKSLGLYPSSSIHEYEEIIKSRTLKRTIAR